MHARAEVWLRQHPRAELRMIRLAADGMTNPKIAAEMGITPRTLGQYWRDVSRRWGCSGRTHVVTTAIRLGYLRVEVSR